MSEDKSKLQLIGEIAQANNKNLELIEELNDRENEIERLSKDNEYLNKVNIELSTEKNRLNNIINELEKDLIEYFKKEYPDRKLEDYNLENCTYDYALVILGRLQELKGSDSNE